MSTVVKDLGAVSAYAYAVEKGYTGTEAEFAELMADYAEVGQRAEDAADSALESKTAAQAAAGTATTKAAEASQSATAAANAASAAQADADAAALDASQAMSAASTATTKATEATTAAATATSAATTATTAKDDAVSAKTAAQTAQTGAETAAASVQSSAAQIQTNAEDISQLKSEYTAISQIIVGLEYSIVGNADISYSVSIPKGSTIKLTNNRDKNASAQLRDLNNNILVNIGTVTAESNKTATVAYDGVVTFTGYCSGGYDMTMLVYSDDSQDANIKKIDSALYGNSVPLNWEAGGFSPSTGAYYSISYAIRTAISSGIQYLYCPPIFNIMVFAYNGDVGDADSFVGCWDGAEFVDGSTYPFLNGNIDLCNAQIMGYNLAISLNYSDNRTMTTVDGAYVNAYEGKLLNAIIAQRVHTYSLNPNIIYQCRNVDDAVYPPYTKWYIQAAVKNQYDRVRVNVRKTTDGYFFCCHDDTINSEARNTDGTAISSTISANGRTLAELNSYDWGIKYGNKYKGATVPMLENALLYSALYNIGLTVEISSIDGWTDTDTANILALFDKYGVTENLIIIDPSGHSVSFLQKFAEHNDYISIYVGGNEEWWSDSANIDAVKALHTSHNRIYVQLYPWGTLPTDEFIALAKSNGFTLYSSVTMDKDDLLTTNLFNKGLNLIEVNNVYNIKDTIRAWVDSLVNV